MTSARAPQRRGDNRLPPHNLDAERAVLGAALLHVGALEVVAQSVTAADFYDARHQHVAATLLHLHKAGKPVDAVTVADELRRLGILDELGGGTFLLELQTQTPSISNAARYARIVRDTATLRRVIAASAQIADIGYGEPDDIAAALARAQDVLADLAISSEPGASTFDVADLAALLATDLEPEQPTFLTRTDGRALLYAGKMHVFQAEPSTGKSWIALLAVAEVLSIGGAAVYEDFEDTAQGIVGRLLRLGVEASTIAQRFAYVNISGPFGAAERRSQDLLLARLNPDLVVIDGVAESLARCGYSEDKADDIVRWFELLPRPLARTGAAVLMLDHVAKDPEQRGRWARGSGAKLGAVDGASYQLRVIAPFSRHRSGKIKLVVAKDRPGGVGAIGETVGLVSIDPYANGERVTMKLEPNPDEVAPGDTWKPTIIMAHVARTLAEAQQPLTAGGVAAVLSHHKRGLVNEAIQRLTQEGYVQQSRGRVKTLTLLRPYDDGAPDPPPATPEHYDDAALFDDDYRRSLDDF